jgi:hypothetical protein
MNKRIEENSKIHFKMISIELEYYDKIEKILNNFMSINKLSHDDIMFISGTLLAVSFHRQSLLMNINYSDNYDRQISEHTFCIYNSIKNVPDAWKLIYPICKEGDSLIFELSKTFIPPKSPLSIKNMKSMEDHDKLQNRFLDNYIKDNLTHTRLEELLIELQEKKLELNLH